MSAPSRRERIATAVLQGLIASDDGPYQPWSSTPKDTAECAIGIADALVAALGVTEPPQPPPARDPDMLGSAGRYQDAPAAPVACPDCRKATGRHFCEGRGVVVDPPRPPCAACGEESVGPVHVTLDAERWRLCKWHTAMFPSAELTSLIRTRREQQAGGVLNPMVRELNRVYDLLRHWKEVADSLRAELEQVRAGLTQAECARDDLQKKRDRLADGMREKNGYIARLERELRDTKSERDQYKSAYDNEIEGNRTLSMSLLSRTGLRQRTDETFRDYVQRCGDLVESLTIERDAALEREGRVRAALERVKRRATESYDQRIRIIMNGPAALNTEQAEATLHGCFEEEVRDIAQFALTPPTGETCRGELERTRGELSETREIAVRNARDCEHLRQSALELTTERDAARTALARLRAKVGPVVEWWRSYNPVLVDLRGIVPVLARRLDVLKAGWEDDPEPGGKS